MADKVDVKRAFEAIARIISEREHIPITVTGIKKKEENETKEETA